MNTVIKFENISKQYRLGLVSTNTLSHDLNRWYQTAIRGKEDPYLKIGEVNDRAHKGHSDYVWALKDINFDVQQGDVLGIIGKNGAGKSTLLKILSKVTAPTTGIIKAKGRIASLLEVGTGFHPEMTGRENIYMNGAIMGMTKVEISRKLDEIVDFSGVERYLDTPVKRYSSGMTVRLGFAIAAHLEPEILVVDEVLAVGDDEFQKKAIGKMQEVSQGQGRTVLFVSHNMNSIQKLCTKGCVLKNGMVEFAGGINESIDLYMRSYNDEVSFWEKNSLLKDSEFVDFKKFYLIDEKNSILDRIVSYNDKIKVCIEFDYLQKNSEITIGFTLLNERGVNVYRSLFTDLDHKFVGKLKLGRNMLQCDLYLSSLKKGKYKIVLDASIHNKVWIVDSNIENERVLTFQIENHLFSPYWSSDSVIAPPINWDIKSF